MASGESRMGGKQSRLRSPPFAIPDSPFAHETVRGDPLTNGFHAYWERTADSFVQVTGGSLFATKGTLNAALDAGTLADATLDITFTGDDWDLEETTLEEATTTQPLQGMRMGNGKSRIGPTWCACKESPLPCVLRI